MRSVDGHIFRHISLSAPAVALIRIQEHVNPTEVGKPSWIGAARLSSSSTCGYTEQSVSLAGGKPGGTTAPETLTISTSTVRAVKPLFSSRRFMMDFADRVDQGFDAVRARLHYDTRYIEVRFSSLPWGSSSILLGYRLQRRVLG